MIVIIGDLIDSRKLQNRTFVQQQLQNCINELNNKYHDDISAKFTVTLGDEFQGLLLSGFNSLRMIDEIQIRMSPVKIRFGIGIGRLHTPINHEVCIGMDGPAFWKAREALNFVHENNDYSRINIHLCLEKHDPSVNLINEIIKLTALQMSGWRKTQKELYQMVLEEGIMSPEKINHQRMAKKIGISSSSLSRRFESSGIKRYMSAQMEAESAIQTINICL